VILRHLSSKIRGQILTGASVVFGRSPVLPVDGRAGTLATRGLVNDAKHGGRRRIRALRALQRLDRRPSPSAALTAAQVLSAAGEPDLAKNRLTAAARRWPGVGVVRLALARSLLEADDPVGATEHLRAALTGDVRRIDIDKLLDAAIEARSHPVIEALGDALPTWPELVHESTRERVRQSRIIANAVEQHRRGDDAALTALLTGDGMARIAVRWAVAEDDPILLRKMCRAVDIAELDAWTARHAALTLRRSGDLSLSTALAEHAVTMRPGDMSLLRVIEVGHSGLSSLRTGWTAPSRTERSEHRGRERTVAYLLHNSLPYSSAGYATRTQGLLTALVRDGWDVHGVTRFGYPYDTWESGDLRHVEPVDDIDGVHYHRLLDGHRVYRKWPIGTYVDQYTRRVERLIRAHQIGAVHGASNYWNGFAAISAARRLGIPSIYEVRGLWELTRKSRDPGYDESEMFALTARLEADACMQADQVITITGALRDLMIERGVPESKITIVPNGVDTDRFVPRQRDPDLTRELGVDGKVVIGYVGSVLDYEGIDTLLHATAQLKERRKDFHVLVVGDGAAFAQCRVLRDTLGLSDLVTFTGRVRHRDVERYYSLVDIAPFPRKPLPVCETVSPLKPFEAMAAGKVPVVSSVAALTEIVTDGDNGLVFDKGDVHSLAAVLDRAVENEDLRRGLSKRARAWVVQERDWSVLVRTLEQVHATAGSVSAAALSLGASGGDR
jgi:glycosyltransferase involved in cell wall biosynthesis